MMVNKVKILILQALLFKIFPLINSLSSSS